MLLQYVHVHMALFVVDQTLSLSLSLQKFLRL